MTLAPVKTTDQGIATIAGVEAGALPHHGGVSRVRAGRAEGRARPRGRQPADDRARDSGPAGLGDRRHRQAGSVRRSPRRLVRHGAHARSGGRAVGRSRPRWRSSCRTWPAATARDPRRQLRGRPAAAQGDDQVDPRHARRVRGGEPQRGRPVHRHHHAARASGRCAAAAATTCATARSAARARSRRSRARSARRISAPTSPGRSIKDRASFNLSLNGSTSFDTPNLYVATPDGHDRPGDVG